MIIQTTRQVKNVIHQKGDALADITVARSVSVVGKAASADWDDDLDAAAETIGRDTHLERLQVEISFDPDDHQALESTAKHLDTIAANIQRRADALKPRTPLPPLDITRTATGMALGTVGGYGVGLLLQEAGKLAKMSGNPYLNTLAMGCTVIGAAYGGAVGARLIEVTVTKFGATSKST